MAPSAKNRQPWNFTLLSQAKEIRTVVDCFEERLGQIEKTSPVGREKKVKLAMAGETVSIMRNVPAVIFVHYAIPALRGSATWAQVERHLDITDIQSIGAAIENMLLQAVSAGIGSLWVCDILDAHDEICRLLDMKYPFIAAVLLGYENLADSS